MAIHVTIYRGSKDACPLAQDDFDTFAAFADELELMCAEKPDCPPNTAPKLQKEALLAFAPHKLKTPHRLAANVTAVTLLVLDVDRCDAEALARRVDALGIEAVVYGSPSDDPTGPHDARRVRVVAPIDREIAPNDCKHTRYAFAEMLDLKPGQGVEGAADPGRLFFCGRMHKTPARIFWRFGC